MVSLLGCLSFTLMFEPLFSQNDVWLSRPGTLNHCVHDDVRFEWAYDINNTEPVTALFWQSMTTGGTMVAWYADTGNVKTYPGYESKTQIMLPEVNAGLILKNVSETDAGTYRIEMGGPGIRDAAILNIYTESELEPLLNINNTPVKFGESFDYKSEAEKVALSVETANNLPADILIRVQGDSKANCTSKTTCVAVISLKEYKRSNLTITVVVNYHICTEQQYTVPLLFAGPVEGTPLGRHQPLKTGAIIGLVISILLLISVVIICLVWIKFRKEEIKDESLGHKKMGFVHNPVIYRPMVAITRMKTPEPDSHDQGTGTELTDLKTTDTQNIEQINLLHSTEMAEEETCLNIDEEHFDSGIPIIQIPKDISFSKPKNKSFSEKARDLLPRFLTGDEDKVDEVAQEATEYGTDVDRQDSHSVERVPCNKNDGKMGGQSDDKKSLLAHVSDNAPSVINPPLTHIQPDNSKEDKQPGDNSQDMKKSNNGAKHATVGIKTQPHAVVGKQPPDKDKRKKEAEKLSESASQSEHDTMPYPNPLHPHGLPPDMNC